VRAPGKRGAARPLHSPSQLNLGRVGVEPIPTTGNEVVFFSFNPVLFLSSPSELSVGLPSGLPIIWPSGWLVGPAVVGLLL
jgi:hypothetical protein